jgi:hypothetical protein
MSQFKMQFVFNLIITCVVFATPEAIADTRIESSGKSPSLVIASPGRFSLNTQFSVFTGTFGAANNKNTTLSYFTETAKYTKQNLGEISLSIPYVVRNGGGVTADETVVSGSAISNSANGIGDIQLKGRYYLIKETDVIPNIDLTGRIKFPSASRDRGLGTGEFDYGVGPSLYKRFGRYIVLLDQEVVFRQRPHGSTLKSIRYDYDVGLGYAFTSKFSGYFFVEGSSKTDIFETASEAHLELVFSGVYRINQDYGINGYLLSGLTDGSPDFGASMGFTRYF